MATQLPSLPPFPSLRKSMRRPLLCLPHVGALRECTTHPRSSHVDSRCAAPTTAAAHRPCHVQRRSRQCPCRPRTSRATKLRSTVALVYCSATAAPCCHDPHVATTESVTAAYCCRVPLTHACLYGHAGGAAGSIVRPGPRHHTRNASVPQHYLLFVLRLVRVPPVIVAAPASARGHVGP